MQTEIGDGAALNDKAAGSASAHLEVNKYIVYIDVGTDHFLPHLPQQSCAQNYSVQFDLLQYISSLRHNVDFSLPK